VEKYGTARQGTDDIIWRTRFACWISNFTNTGSEYVILTAFPRQQGYAKAPQFYNEMTKEHISITIYVHLVNAFRI
jgi:hypothetical protein